MIITLKENRLRIFASILLLSVFMSAPIFLVYAFSEPVINRISELSLEEIFLFGGVSVFGLLLLCLLLVSLIFMLYKMFFLAQITLSQKGISGSSISDIVNWNDITNIDYVSIRNKGAKIISLFSIIALILHIPINVTVLIRFPTNRIIPLLASEQGEKLPGIIRLSLKNQKQILLDIDESFIVGEHTALDIIKAYKSAQLRES